MALINYGYEYPSQTTSIEPFPSDFTKILSPPPGLIENDWPPIQLVYIGGYLSSLGCKTIVIESHYVDRDYINDMALFHSLSLRGYPNFCQRMHFFNEEFDQASWKHIVADISSYQQQRTFLQNSYLGFCVIRPLPGSPIGRTVLSSYGPTTSTGLSREFGGVREYDVHLGGFTLKVKGLAFQQQDQGVSACATAALWSAMHKNAHAEHLDVPTPAQITKAASRYLLAGGRALPSEGLNIQQICEAIRAAGLQPLLYRAHSFEHDRGQLLGYLSSGLAPVLAIRTVPGGVDHALCAVGLKIGEVAPQVDPDLHYRDSATSVKACYIHDDRLGPYALANLGPWTLPSKEIGTGLLIESEQSYLLAIIVPVPPKLRMPVTRLRSLGRNLAQAVGNRYSEFSKDIAFNCRYRLATDYKQLAYDYGLTGEGLYRLCCDTVLSRYLGVIEISITRGPIFDVLLDATETMANPSVLAFVRRPEFPEKYRSTLQSIAKKYGAQMIW